MKKYFAALFVFVALGAAPINALADASPSPLPVIVATLQTQAAQTTVDTATFLGSIFSFVMTHGGLGMPVEIMCICLLLIASMKVTVLDKLIWNHLGAAQPLLPPLLGLVVGLIMVKLNGPISIAAIIAFLGSGAGAIAVHELLDSIKAFPGLGPVYVSVISTVEGYLGGVPVGVNDQAAAVALAPVTATTATVATPSA